MEQSKLELLLSNYEQIGAVEIAIAIGIGIESRRFSSISITMESAHQQNCHAPGTKSGLNRWLTILPPPSIIDANNDSL
jgi:hypothetical protein